MTGGGWEKTEAVAVMAKRAVTMSGSCFFMAGAGVVSEFSIFPLFLSQQSSGAFGKKEEK
jgi:hypothetical protein